MRRVIFIDTENVGDFKILMDLNLTPNDEIIIPVSENSNRIDFQTIKYLMSTEVKMEFYNCDVGFKNAMDFNIVMLVSVYVSNHKDEEFELCVFSNDLIYSRILPSLTEVVNCKCKFNFMELHKPTLTYVELKEGDVELLVKNVLSCNSVDEIHQVLGITSTTVLKLNELHNALFKLYGELGKVLYTNLKNYYSLKTLEK